jgi:hypothetical protein
MAALVAHRTRHGNFASYHRRFHPDRSVVPQCKCGAVNEPRHVTVCPVTWRDSRKAKDRHKIDTGEELYKFVVTEGAKTWFPKLLA